MMRYLARVALIVALLSPLVVSGGEIKAMPVVNLRVRSGPGLAYPATGILSESVVVRVEGRSEAENWVLVRAPDGLRGWVARRYLILQAGTDLDSVPIITSAAKPPDALSAEPVYDDTRIARLLAAPVLPTPSARVLEIFARGQARGQQANVFVKVGDCQTEHPAYLTPIGDGDYDLGPYDALQATVDYFNVVPRGGAVNAFEIDSMAVYDGFTVDALLDPIWADPTYCMPGESPLACEYRLNRPAVAIVMVGGMDKKSYVRYRFEENMREVVRYTIRQGIIPVLTTYPGSPEGMWDALLDINVHILDIAEDEDIPLINLWLASRTLPNYGLQQDDFHLSYKGKFPGDFDVNAHKVSFGGDELRWGQTLHNLLTLQTLDIIREATTPPQAAASPTMIWELRSDEE